MRRAKPLPPDERRTAIIDAAIPVIIANGHSFTTRQVAEVAGIAEGTLFRVFPTKDNLLHAVVEHIMDPTEICTRIATETLDDDLALAIESILVIVGDEMRIVGTIMHILYSRPEAQREKFHQTRTDAHAQRNAAIVDAISTALEPYAGELCVTTRTAATWLRAMSFVKNSPFLLPDELGDSHQIASILVHGLTGCEK